MHQYRVCQKIGSGTFGEVLLAEHRNPARQDAVAIKFIRCPSITDANQSIREALSISKMNIPGVVQYSDVFLHQSEVDGLQICMVMPYYPDGDLALLLKGTTLTEPEVIDYTLQIVKVLRDLHSQNYVHRDLKPENILLRRDPDRIRLHVADFGLLRHLEEDAMLTTRCGTPEYMAPEQVLGQYNQFADIWALGCIFYRMLLPAVAPKVMYMYLLTLGEARFHQYIHGQIYGCSKWLACLLSRMLTAQPDGRLTAMEITAILLRFSSKSADTNLPGCITCRTASAEDIANSLRLGHQLQAEDSTATVGAESRELLIPPGSMDLSEWISLPSKAFPSSSCLITPGSMHLPKQCAHGGESSLSDIADQAMSSHLSDNNMLVHTRSPHRFDSEGRAGVGHSPPWSKPPDLPSKVTPEATRKSAQISPSAPVAPAQLPPTPLARTPKPQEPPTPDDQAAFITPPPPLSYYSRANYISQSFDQIHTVDGTLTTQQRIKIDPRTPDPLPWLDVSIAAHPSKRVMSTPSPVVLRGPGNSVQGSPSRLTSLIKGLLKGGRSRRRAKTDGMPQQHHSWHGYTTYGGVPGLRYHPRAVSDSMPNLNMDYFSPVGHSSFSTSCSDTSSPSSRCMPLGASTVEATASFSSSIDSVVTQSRSRRKSFRSSAGPVVADSPLPSPMNAATDVQSQNRRKSSTKTSVWSSFHTFVSLTNRESLSRRPTLPASEPVTPSSRGMFGQSPPTPHANPLKDAKGRKPSPPLISQSQSQPSPLPSQSQPSPQSDVPSYPTASSSSSGGALSVDSFIASHADAVVANLARDFFLGT